MKVYAPLVSVIFFSALAFGQPPAKNFTLSGTIFDLNEAVVLSAEVAIRDEAGKSYRAPLDNRGRYRILLPAGVYTLEATAIGYRTTRVSRIVGEAGAKRELDVTLMVGRCEDCNGAMYGKRWDDETVVSGVVYDLGGAVIANARVAFRDSSNRERIVRTDENGRYHLTMPNGTYAIEISATGFKDFKLSNYRTVGTKDGIRFDVVLDVKGCDDPTVICTILTADPIKQN